MAHDVFISYSTEDKPAADAVCAILEKNGVRCWIAPRDIMPGADWGESIVKGIRSSKVLLLVFSTNANKSKQIKREVEIAADGGVTIVPLRIENILPTESFKYFLGNIHWLDALTSPLEKHLEEVAEKVKVILSTDSVSSPEGFQTSLPSKVPEKGEETSGFKRYVLLPRPLIVALSALISAVLLIVVIANRDRIIPFIQPATTAINLSSTWSCNDRGTYTIQQKGRMISWMGSNPPYFANSFDGLITDQGYIEGSWHDLPGYAVYGAGKLTLKIENPFRLVAVSQTGNFGGSIWTKN